MAVMALALILQLSQKPECSHPGMAPQFWPAVIHGESSNDPLAIGDDDAHASYYPANVEEAVHLARTLWARGHSIGIGLSQLTARTEQQFVARFHITLVQAFDACTNMHIGATHYVSGALQIYNSGRANSAPVYAARVEARLSAPPLPIPAQTVPASAPAVRAYPLSTPGQTPGVVSLSINRSTP